MSGGEFAVIAHVCARGKDAAGLTRYLYGDGRKNEHTDQHMVAGSASLRDEWAGYLDKGEATQLGRLVEAAWRAPYAEDLVLAGVSDGHGVSRENLRSDAPTAPGQEHVYHVTFSLHPDDEPLSDEQWETVADEYVKEMGFTAGDEGRAAQWIAVRHGVSDGGNDHIHVVVNMVRQDGRTIDLDEDWARTQSTRRLIEARHEFLRKSHDTYRRPGQAPERGASLPAYSMREHRDAQEAARRAKRPVAEALPDRVKLQRIVRAAAETSTTEAEFIQEVGEQVEIVAARWAPGGRNDVVGYQVRSLREGDAGGPGPWMSASKLAPDLTLSKLRPGWAGNETPQSKDRALALWRDEVGLADDGPRTVAVEDELAAAYDHLERWRNNLTISDPGDARLWKEHTAHAAGAVSVLAQADGLSGRQFGYAADALARDSLSIRGGGPSWSPGQTDEHRAPVVPRGLSDAELAARHMNLALRASHPDSGRGWIAVLQQLQRTVDAIRTAHAARAENMQEQALAQFAQAPIGQVLQRSLDAQQSAATSATERQAGTATDVGRRTWEASSHTRRPAGLPVTPPNERGRSAAPNRPGPEGPRRGRSY